LRDELSGKYGLDGIKRAQNASWERLLAIAALAKAHLLQRSKISRKQ